MILQCDYFSIAGIISDFCFNDFNVVAMNYLFCKNVPDFQMVTSDVDKDCVRGIGFAATCSLVALDKQCQPISVSPSGTVHLTIQE